MILLPIIIFLVFRIGAPDYALGAMLLAGVATGVVAPFISNLVQANTPLVVSLAVITSFLAPFSLPLLVKLLEGESFNLPVGGMIQMLALIIFVPLVACETIRRAAPRIVDVLDRHNFLLSLIFFGLFYVIHSVHLRFYRLGRAQI